ncbi:MAG: GAF domain-containing protein, partial [Pseudonocardia sp.]
MGRSGAAEPDPLFAGGGETGQVMAGLDWAANPLGPPATWPSALRSAVRILLTSRFAMWMAWGPELTMLYNDAYWRDTLRSKHPWALGRPASQVWSEVWDEAGPRIASVLETGVATWDEDLLLFLERSGYPEETYHTFSYSPLSDDAGVPAGMLCVVTEVTDRVLSERRMATLRVLATEVGGSRTAREVLAATAQRLADNPRDLPFTLVYLFDETGDGQEPRTARLAAVTGARPGDPVAPDVLSAGPDEDAAWPVEALRSGQTVLVEDLAERFATIPAGAWADPPRAAVVVPLSGAGDGPSGFVIAGLNPFRDFDARYRGFVELLAHQIEGGLTAAGAYEAERRRAESLAELDRAKTEFFTGISHEFRTPLTLIMGPLGELRTAPAVAADEQIRTEVDAAYRNAHRLAKLVNTLLDFSRLQAGRMHARFEPVDLPALTAELASVFRSAIERAGLTFTVDATAPTEPVHVDRDMWEKVVLNLLSNALKFTFEGGIAVTMREEGRAAVLTVTDTGTGIPTDELPHLFERFHRIPRVRSRSGEGSGIGLAMVRELVGLHGGSVSVTSTEGAGTTFTVTVPMGTDHLPADQISGTEARPDMSGVPGASGVSSVSGVSAAAQPFVAEALRWLPPESPPEAAATGPQAAGGPGGPSPARVLVADDNADMRDYLRRLLATRHQVRLAADGTAAFAAALDDPPDLVISDVMMPGLDGTQLVAALRTDPRTARVPVLLLSARAGQEAAVEGLAAGADDYLVKPFAAAELLARVDGHVRLGRARNDAEREFRTLADATPALVWAEGPGQNRIFVNRAWSQFVGATETDTDLGQGWRDRIHPDDRARYEQVRAERVGRGFEVEYRLRAADGRYRWVLDRGAPVAPSGYVGGCLDIDTRYRERERERVLAAVGAALDRETRLTGRRDALVRTLVAERIANVARLLVVDPQPRVVAAATPDVATDRLVARIEPDWETVRTVLETGEAVHITVDEDYLAAWIPDATQRELRRRLALDDMAFVPLTTRGRTVGVLAVFRERPAPEPDSGDLALLVEIGRRAATALDNAQLYEREQETNRRMTLLQRATAALSAAATRQQVAEVAVAQFRALLGAPAVGLWELQPDSLEAVTMRGWSAAVDGDWRSLPLTAGLITTEAILRGSAVWVPDTSSWPGRAPGRAAAAEYGYRSLAALPLVAGGRSVGVVCVGFPRAQKPDRSTRISAVALAHQCAQAYQRASLLAVESAARRTAEEFAAAVSALSGATTPAEVIEVILDRAAGLGAVDAVVVLRTGDQLELLARRGGPTHPDNRLDLLAAHPIAHSVRSGEAVWPDTGSGLPGWPPGRLSTVGADLPVQVVLPLRLGGSTIGALGMAFADPPAFGADERATLLTILAQCAQALDRARLHQAEHEVADVLQRSLLPPELPELDRLGSAARYLPGAAGSQTGGDWYDLLPLADECAALVVGDVVGQGPGAAAVMGQLRSALAAYLLEGHAPAEALELLDAFARRVPGARGSTCACLILDWGNGELRWARAGHLPVLLVDTAGARLLDDGGGTVLGVSGRPPYAEARAPVTPGASVVLYTDGLVERRGEILDEGLRRLV